MYWFTITRMSIEISMFRTLGLNLLVCCYLYTHYVKRRKLVWFVHVTSLDTFTLRYLGRRSTLTAAFSVTPNYGEKMKLKKTNDSSHKPRLYHATVIIHFTCSLSPDYDNDYGKR